MVGQLAGEGMTSEGYLDRLDLALLELLLDSLATFFTELEHLSGTSSAMSSSVKSYSESKSGSSLFFRHLGDML